ncbi:MAG: hypothetical protein LUC37_05595 [Prevotella sp.]|nr:hypothetical protein [Prevotella sp.]
MRLQPKRVGDEFTLDDYNACQYLMYHMDCWSETITLSTLPTTGSYATYTIRDPQELLEWQGMISYKVAKAVGSKNYIEIEIDDKDLIEMVKTVDFYYKNPVTYEIDEELDLHEDPSDDTSSLITSETVSANDGEEIPVWSVNEVKEQETLEQYDTLTVPVTAGTDCIQVPLNILNEEGELDGITETESLLGNKFTFHFDYTAPQIDVANGRANTSDEILIDSVYEINRLLEFAPTDGTKIVYRLDSNKTYKLTMTNTIWDGMNVEFRGGTNVNAVLDCSTCGRAFIVQDEATLTLVNITIENGDTTIATGNSTFYKGYGGGILVIYDQNKNSEYFGNLVMDKCEINNCKSDSGGAIYSFHCGLTLTDCSFNNNTSKVTGGAIYYVAHNILMSMDSVTGKVGQKVMMTCHVETVDGEPVTQGKIKFYVEVAENEYELIDTYTMSKSLEEGNTPGDGLFYYTIPDVRTKQIPVVAYYIGTRDIEVGAVKSSIYVVLADKVTATVKDVTKVFPGDTITLTATVVDSDKNTFSLDDGYFIIDGVKQDSVSGKDGVYTMEYVVSDGAKEDMKVTFDFDSVDCTSNTATIQVIYGITGYFVNTGTSSIPVAMANNWKSVGVTDLYVRSVSGLDNIKSTTLYEVINRAKGMNIRINATINVFYNISNLNTSEKTWSETDSERAERITKIKGDILKIHEGVGDSISGFCLDYIRLRGTERVTDQSHVETLQAHLKDLTDYIYSLNPDYIVSACVMPEIDDAQYTYGQKPTEMLKYVDYVIPMIYRGNYKGDLDWIKNRMGWYLCHVSQVRCIGDLQTYANDNDVVGTILKKDALEGDLKALMDAIHYSGSDEDSVGCSHEKNKHRDNGYILFREGYIGDSTFNAKNYPISYRDWRGD